MPWDRPIMTIFLWAKAFFFSTSRSRSRSSIRMPAASLRRIAREVSRMSEEVNPMWMKRPSSPTFSVTEVRKAITSCLVVFSISSIRATSKPALALILRSEAAGISPRRAMASQARISMSSQVR